MIDQPPQGRPATAWALALAWIAGILAAIPYARDLQRAFDSTLGSGSLRWLSIAAVGSAAAWAALKIWRSIRRLSRARAIAVLAGAATLIYLAVATLDTAAEAVHFVLFGILALLVFRAFAIRGRGSILYLNTLLVCLLASITDEALQWFMPGRYWDFNDILRNALASAWVIAVFAVGFRPGYATGIGSPPMIRTAALLTALCAILLALCFTNTPAFAQRLVAHFPVLTDLFDNDHPMAEYGYCHRLSHEVHFRSRFGLDELRSHDAMRATDAGPILAEAAASGFPTNRRMVIAAATDPFLFEALNHLERRNHYFGVLPKYRFDPNGYTFHATVAWRENEILEAVFPRTLDAAGQRWTDELKEALAEHVQPGRYTSPIGRHLICRVRLPHIWAATVSVIGACAVLWVLAPRIALACAGPRRT